jgi:dehydrogenase/reductase SDR family protein 1
MRILDCSNFFGSAAAATIVGKEHYQVRVGRIRPRLVLAKHVNPESCLWQHRAIRARNLVPRGSTMGLVKRGRIQEKTGCWREQPLWRWDAISAGARAHYHASQLAAPAMISQRRGLIVNISFWAAQKHIGNVAYGVSKAATDKMTADMATELKLYGVAVVSLYAGLVRTEKVMEAAKSLDLTNSESPEFIGRAVASLAVDTDVLRHTGRVLVAAGLAKEYGFTDIDGKTPRPLTLTDV